MFVEVRQLSARVTQRQLEGAVTALCADRRIDGVLVRTRFKGGLVGWVWPGAAVAAGRQAGSCPSQLFTSR